MANQVGNTGVSRFDSNQLRPNGALPTRNGIKGQSLGRLSRTGALQQDTVELTKNVAHKGAAHAKVANTTADPMAQIKHLLDSVNSDSATAAKAHHASPSTVYTISTEEVTSEATSQVSEVASAEEAAPASRKAEFLEFATSFVNSVKGGDAEQILNKFMDMFASRTEMEFVNGEWSPISGIPNDVPEWTSENREFELVLTQLIDDVGFADPDVLAGTLLNWFDAGATTTEGSWHQWSPSGDFAGYTREELSSAIADVLTNAGFTLNHIDHASGMVNGGADTNENLAGGSRVALGDSVVSLFRERVANATSQAAPTPPPSSTTSSSNVSSTSQASGQMTTSDVLDKLRGMMPGWVINGDWQSGFRNIQIDQSVLERMASDPAEFDRVMEIIRGFEELVPELEKWAEQNPGKSLLLSFNTDEDGATSLIARMRDLTGNVRSATVGAGDIAAWRENLQQILESFSRETEEPENANNSEGAAGVQNEAATDETEETTQSAQTTAAASRNRPANPAAIRNMWRDTNQRGEAVLTLIRASIGNSNGTGQASLGAMANGGMNVSEADRLRAQEMVGENGFFGVQQTTDRIMSFAKALVGENASAEDIEKMREAVQRGFDEVAHLFGGFNNLPGVTQDTHAAIMQAFDDWAAGASS